VTDQIDFFSAQFCAILPLPYAQAAAIIVNRHQLNVMRRRP